MATCEMCGYSGTVQEAIVEGAVLFLCDKCLKYGDAIELKKTSATVIDQRLTFMKRTHSYLSESTEETLVSEYGLRVKKAREKRNLSQDQLAQALAERVSLLQRVESGNMEPPLKLARKLEQYLKIQLVQKEEKTIVAEKRSSSADTGMTIGDVVKIKDAKK